MTDEIVDALAVARLTRLVIEDRVPFGWLRERLKSRAWGRALDGEAHVLAFTERKTYVDGKPDPYLVELLECPWCASIWVALAVLFLRRLPGWRYLSRVLAASQVAGMAAVWVER